MKEICHCRSAKVYAELTLTALSDNDDFLVITGGSVEGHDLRHLRAVAAERDMGDVALENVTESTLALSLAGPRSGGLTQELTGVPEAEWNFLDAKQVLG